MKPQDNLEQIRWNVQSADGQVMLSLAWEVFVLGVAILSIVNLAVGILVRNQDTD